jgi:hypothetical protein
MINTDHVIAEDEFYSRSILRNVQNFNDENMSLKIKIYGPHF